MALDGWKSNLSPDATAYLERMERKLEGLTRKISSAESTISYLTKVTNRITSGSTSSGVVQGVIPSSVNVGSGSYSVATDGTITFSGVSSISLNGVFDGLGADMYALYLEYQQTVGTNGFGLRLRASGVDSATGYDTQRLQIVNSTAGPIQTLNSSSGTLVITSAQANALYGIKAEIFSPALVIESRIVAAGLQSANPMSAATGQGAFSNAILHRSATAYDGLTLVHTDSAHRSTGSLKVVKIA